MNERVMQFRVGVMMVSAVIIALILVLLFDGFPSFIGEAKYVIYISFSQAPGVSEGTPVRKSGILIGRVKSVSFAEDLGIRPTEGMHVIVAAEIEADRKLRRNETPQIGKELLGDAVIEFVLDENNTDESIIEPRERVAGKVISDPLQAFGNIESNLSLAIGSIAQTADEVGQLSKRLSNLLANNDEQMRRIFSKTEGSLDQFQSAVANANDLLGDPQLKANLKQVAASLPQAVAELNASIANVKQTFERADRNLANLEGFTKPLGERGTQILGHVDEAAQNLAQVLRDTRTFSQSLNSPNGSLGRLLNDQQLYSNLNSAVTNINGLTRDLKPILHDARAFSDKIARHPEKLGVRGAIFSQFRCKVTQRSNPGRYHHLETLPMTDDDPFHILQREAAHMHVVAPWLSISVDRDATGKPRAEATLNARFQVDPEDLAGSLIREIHRRLDEFESQLDD